ncbi:MAG: DUF2141 domain-containing protein [Minicystis sp.]
MSPLPRSLQRAPWLVAGALLVQATSSQAEAPPARDVLSVRLVNLRNDSGRVGCGLWASEKGFPRDRSVALQTRWCSITSKASLCAFDPAAAGTYAVACFHDENNNGVLDTGLFGIPKEGVVASNHAKGFMGPPSFKDARFSFSGKATALRLEMAY